MMFKIHESLNHFLMLNFIFALLDIYMYMGLNLQNHTYDIFEHQGSGKTVQMQNCHYLHINI